MKITKNKWFTLVELLVVITIIGLLATLWIQSFAWAQQKARDTTRISHITSLKGTMESFYTDNWVYPWVVDVATLETDVKSYSPIPKDPKTGQPACVWTWWTNTHCDYYYAVWPDDNGVTKWAFELSIWLESKQNLTNKADDAKDNWDCPYRIEVWTKYSLKSWWTAELKTSCLTNADSTEIITPTTPDSGTISLK